MKKYLHLILIMSSLFCYAQNNNSFIITGNLNFNRDGFENSNSEDDYNLIFSTSIKAGYIFTESNLEVGLGFGYNRATKFNFDIRNPYSYSQIFSAVIYSKKYFPINDKLAFNVSGELGYGTNNYTDPNEFNQDIFSLAFKPGFIYFVSKNIGFISDIGSVTFLRSIIKDENFNDSTNNLVINFNPSNIRLGLAFLF